MEPYYRKLGSLCSILLGTFLLSEHIWVWGGFDVDDLPFGHEWYGILLILGGILLSARKNGEYILRRK